MYKQNSGSSVLDYLNPKNTGEPKAKRVWKQIWKWTKVVLFLFIIVSMLWGCVQMYQSDYMVQQVTDMTGNKVFAPGTTFEIIIQSLGEKGGKNHMFIGGIDNMQEYSYNAITTWGDAFRITKSPFYGFFVYPLAWILIGFVNLFMGANKDVFLPPEEALDAGYQARLGISVMFAMLITVILLRFLVLAFSWKQQANQDKMQDMQQKQAEITAKYKAKAQNGKMTTQMRQQQQMEMQALYQKEGIKPMANMAMTFAPLPFLFAFYAIVRSSRILKDANVGAISLIEQPWQMIQEGQPVYWALLATYLPLQVVSMLLPIYYQYKRQRGVPLSEAQKKSRRNSLIMQIVMLVVFIFIVASIASGVAIYWIFSSAFQIAQTVFFFYWNKHRRGGSGNKEKQRRLRQQKRAEEKQARQIKSNDQAEIRQDIKDEKRADKLANEDPTKRTGWDKFWRPISDWFKKCGLWIKKASIATWNWIKKSAIATGHWFKKTWNSFIKLFKKKSKQDKSKDEPKK